MVIRNNQTLKLPPHLEGKVEILPDGSYKIYARADRRRCSPLDRPAYEAHVRALRQNMADWDEFCQTNEYREQVNSLLQ